MFRKENQDPNEPPLVLAEIKRLKVKQFRNLPLAKDKLKPYLSEDCKSFAFNGSALVADVADSINEISKCLMNARLLVE